MAGSALVRIGWSVDDRGVIKYTDIPIGWEEADGRAGFRLDRRKAWAFINGKLCDSVTMSRACSGCYEGPDSYASGVRGMGCRECGYHGRVRITTWIPITE